MKVKITNFAKRHFNPKSSGTKILNNSIEKVETIINNSFDNVKLLDGYADFCKLLIIENFTDAKVGTAKITNENYQWLRSHYINRTEDELPVLTRALHLPMPAEKAKYLVFVLYTKEQLKKEYDDNNNEKFKDHEMRTGKVMTESDRKALLSIEGLKFDLDGSDWGVVSIMGQNNNVEEPMTPATMIRNHLGTKFGGSGSEINKEAYKESVAFWNKNAIIK